MVELILLFELKFLKNWKNIDLILLEKHLLKQARMVANPLKYF